MAAKTNQNHGIVVSLTRLPDHVIQGMEEAEAGIEVVGDTEMGEEVEAGRGTTDGELGARVEIGHPEVLRTAVTARSETLDRRSVLRCARKFYLEL
jgi:hypothetical protein